MEGAISVSTRATGGRPRYFRCRLFKHSKRFADAGDTADHQLLVGDVGVMASVTEEHIRLDKMHEAGIGRGVDQMQSVRILLDIDHDDTPADRVHTRKALKEEFLVID